MVSADKTGALGPSMLRVLYDLVASPKTPTELANLEKKHLSHVSRILRTLRDNGLVEYTESGSRERYYRTTAEGFDLLRKTLR